MTDEQKPVEEQALSDAPAAPDHDAAQTGTDTQAQADVQGQEQAEVVRQSRNPLNRTMRYPNAYTWLLLLSAMDIMLTWTIFHFGGGEMNPIARWVIDHWNLDGMIIYKFVLILFFIMICEVVGHLRDSTGRLLSRASVLIAMVPVVWSLTLLARYSGQH